MPPRPVGIPANSGGGPTIPPAAWRRRLDEARPTWPGRPVGLKLSMLFGMLPVIVRTARSMVREKLRRSETTVWTHGTRARPVMGVPLGGIGGGTITRGWRGHFVRWQMRPGVYEWRTVPADQFSLWVRREGGAAPTALVLSPKPVSERRRNRRGTPSGGAVDPPALAAAGLDSWNWGLDEARATYHALFPRAWTVYEEPVPGLRLTCRQVSPVIPHNYKETSYPVGVFVWTVENTGSDAADVALMFSFQNGTGGPNDRAGGHVNRPFDEKTGSEADGGETPEAAGAVGLAGATGAAGACPTGVAGVCLRHVHRQRLVVDANRRVARGQAVSGQIDAGGPASNHAAAGRTVFEDPLTFAIGARTGQGVEVTRRTRFVLAPAAGTRRTATGTDATLGIKPPTAARTSTAADLWRDFAEDGRLDDCVTAPPSPSTRPPAAPARPGEVIGAAVAARARVPAGERRELVFVLAWDMPVARFGAGTGWYRRYTKFFGRDGEAAPALAREAVANYRRWEEAIDAWQKPVLGDPSLPDWYKGLLFNETYYVVDGGTIWTAGRVAAPPDAFLPEPPVGHFAYLEGHEYRMYNTYDVHFSASFALATLWPELELSLQRDFAGAVLAEDPETVVFLGTGGRGPRKRRGAVPHDLGTPGEDPWRRLNAYAVQDVGRWKDLNPKFVLQVYRDYRLAREGPPRTAPRGAVALTGGPALPEGAAAAFLAEVWPAVEAAMDYMLQFDQDGDGLIENEGVPDQTYDVWTMSGPSAYCGCLWLASLAAAAELAEAVAATATEIVETTTPPRRTATASDPATRAAEWRSLLARASEAFESRLWNGEYYLYDASGGRHSDSVMADQLSGQWFARASGLPDVVPADNYRKVLRKVFDLNVMGWRGTGRAPTAPGERGAVNGLRPDGRFDRTCLQSAEVWTGTTLSLAAAMLQEGLVEEAFATAQGVYLSVYRDFPLWFQTPEAIDVDGVYRAIGYMRPLAVWAMQWEIERRGKRSWPIRRSISRILA